MNNAFLQPTFRIYFIYCIIYSCQIIRDKKHRFFIFFVLNPIILFSSHELIHLEWNIFPKFLFLGLSLFQAQCRWLHFYSASSNIHVRLHQCTCNIFSIKPSFLPSFPHFKICLINITYILRARIKTVNIF